MLIFIDFGISQAKKMETMKKTVLLFVAIVATNFVMVETIYK